MLVYLFYISQDNSPTQGGRRSEFIRNLKFFKYFVNYFPVSIVKTVDLPPERNYIIGYHPHGIIGMGAFTNFATEGSHISQIFPGIKFSLLTLGINFKIPFYREYLLSLGVCDVGRKSCDYILNSGPGNSIVIVVGGAAESLDSHPGSYQLTLAERKGFVRVALDNGADIVPTISFGETNIFHQRPNPHGSRLRNFQTSLRKYIGFTFPLFYGRGVFNYDYGILPHRVPIVTVVGEPIQCPKTAQPRDEEVDRYHSIYVEALVKLFETNKVIYGYPDSELRII